VSSEPAAKGPRRRLSAEERSVALLDAAESILVRDGSAALTLGKLAAEAGVTQPLLYHYFDGREALLAALLERSYERFGASVVEAVMAEPTFAGKLRVLARQAVDPGPAAQLVSLVEGAMARPEPRQDAFENQGVLSTLFVATLLQDEYGLDATFARVVAGTAVTSSQGFAMASASAGWSVDERVEVLVELLTGLFAHATTMAAAGLPTPPRTRPHRGAKSTPR
jgi:AcrR family transcriptional regulator